MSLPRKNIFIATLSLEGAHLSDREEQRMLFKIRQALQEIANAEGFSPNKQAISISFKADGGI